MRRSQGRFLRLFAHGHLQKTCALCLPHIRAIDHPPQVSRAASSLFVLLRSPAQRRRCGNAFAATPIRCRSRRPTLSPTSNVEPYLVSQASVKVAVNFQLPYRVSFGEVIKVGLARGGRLAETAGTQTFGMHAPDLHHLPSCRWWATPRSSGAGTQPFHRSLPGGQEM